MPRSSNYRALTTAATITVTIPNGPKWQLFILHLEARHSHRTCSRKAARWIFCVCFPNEDIEAQGGGGNLPFGHAHSFPAVEQGLVKPRCVWLQSNPCTFCRLEIKLSALKIIPWQLIRTRARGDAQRTQVVMAREKSRSSRLRERVEHFGRVFS